MLVHPGEDLVDCQARGTAAPHHLASMFGEELFERAALRQPAIALEQGAIDLAPRFIAYTGHAAGSRVRILARTNVVSIGPNQDEIDREPWAFHASGQTAVPGKEVR